MRGLPPAETGPTSRIRRWDAVILGGALPGLVAAVRLGMRGLRVLVLEEEAPAVFPALREPFWMGGAQPDGVLASCLRELRVPLIDRRRVEPDPVAFQAVLPDARVDVGEPPLYADELVAWGLCKPDEARALIRGLGAAAEAERDAILAATVVHPPRRRALGGRRGTPSLADVSTRPEPRNTRPRGLPVELDEASPGVAALLAAQVRALSNLGQATPSAQARARLLGAPLEGGAVVRGGEASLRDILRRRVESLYGEFRSVPEAFRLVSAGGQPGIAPDAAGESGEVWVGRVFVLNAPRDALALAVAQEPPELLRGPPASRRRLALHLRVDAAAVPEAMGPRVIVLRDASLPGDAGGVVCLRRLPVSGTPDEVDVVASAVVPADPSGTGAREGEIQQAVASLMPFSDGRMRRMPTHAPRWDDEARLADPRPGTGWPTEPELRVATRQPIYQLERSAVAGLGFEGDLLLGWRGGDAIAADLA